MLNWLTSLLEKKEPIENNNHYKVRENSFFLDEKFHHQYLKKGWVKIEKLVLDEEIDSFMKTFKEISNLEGFELKDNLLNSGRLFNPEIRRKTQSIINQNAKTILPRIFDMSKVDEHTGGAYQVKPPHPNSDLLIHQDSTVIDEANDYCLFVWIPFCDVTLENGPISFLNGSHLWGNIQRSLGVPWQFRNHIRTLYKYVKPIEVKKGDVLIFDPACIHASAPNMSKEIRHAITITVLRKNYQLVYYFRNKEIDNSLIEKYEVNENFYYNYDFISKPDETKWRKEVLPFEAFERSEKEIVKLIKKYMSE